MKRLALLAALCFTQSVCSTVVQVDSPGYNLTITRNPFTEEVVQLSAYPDGTLQSLTVERRTDAVGMTAAGTALGGVVGAAITAAALK